MSLDNIADLWNEIEKNLGKLESDKNPEILDQIVEVATKENRHAELAKVRIYKQRLKPIALSESEPEKIEFALRKDMRIVQEAGENIFVALGYEALAKHFAVRGDLIRVNECLEAMRLIYDELHLTVPKVFATFHISDFVDEVRYERTLESVGEPLEEFLRNVEVIDLSKVATRIGGYVTHDRDFFLKVTERIKEMQHQIDTGRSFTTSNIVGNQGKKPRYETISRPKLAKPENFLLRADPGSGKSFFVRQVAEQLPGFEESGYLVHNLSGYRELDEALSDIALDILIALNRHSLVVSFIDEADSTFREEQLFRSFIAIMNGEPFFLHGKKLSFSDANLVFFYAMSSSEDKLQAVPKWQDFLSRVPSGNRFTLPDINSTYQEKLYRAVALLRSGRIKIRRVHARVLFFIGLKRWSSSRELERLLRQAVQRIPPSRDYLELGDLPISAKEIVDIQNQSEKDQDGNPKCNIFGFTDRIISIEG